MFGRPSLLLAALVLVPQSELLAAEASPKPAARPRIELALLLDTSSSMNGLINQAQTKLWKIVGEFETAKRGGQHADVYVALYEYGNSSLSGESGYIRQVMPLTRDLDKISEELFALTTNGGSEHCGQVIGRAVEELGWSSEGADLRSLFIAGNEQFTQGPVDYKEACHAAANKNITVSTIHCGGYDQGVSGMWADGARLADGAYMNIDHNSREPHIASPQDQQLAELNSRLNATYRAYGAAPAREEALERQQVQDSNALAAAPAANLSRIAAKAGRLYNNASWDLVDAVSEKKVDLAKLKQEELPEDLRSLTAEELSKRVAELTRQRGEVKAEIKQLSAERAKFVAAERAKLAGKGANALDEAIVKAVRTQAERQSYEFGE